MARDFEVNVNVKDLDLFKELLRAISELMNDDRVPIELKLALQARVVEIVSRVDMDK